MRCLGIVVTIFLLGIATAWGSSAELLGKPHLRVADREVTAPAPETMSSLVRKVRVYALMSELAYRNYSGGQPAADQVRHTSGETSQLLRDRQERARRWEQLDAALRKVWDFRGNSKLPCASDTDNDKGMRGAKGTQENLEFDIWVNRTTVPPQVVVAIRGTDQVADIVGSEQRSEDQYAKLHEAIVKEKIAEACKFAGQGAVVTTTGHELGGGLAQHLFYTSQAWSMNNVRTSVVFEPSPLPGWYLFGTAEERARAMYYFNATLAGAVRYWHFPEVMADQLGFGIIRVNEGLSYNMLFRQFEPEGPYMAALNLEFENGYLSRHSMSDLAYDLSYFPSPAPIPEHLKALTEKVVRDPLLELRLTSP
jgi:hypothetical protein